MTATEALRGPPRPSTKPLAKRAARIADEGRSVADRARVAVIGAFEHMPTSSVPHGAAPRRSPNICRTPLIGPHRRPRNGNHDADDVRPDTAAARRGLDRPGCRAVPRGRTTPESLSRPWCRRSSRAAPSPRVRRGSDSPRADGFRITAIEAAAAQTAGRRGRLPTRHISSCSRPGHRGRSPAAPLALDLPRVTPPAPSARSTLRRPRPAPDRQRSPRQSRCPDGSPDSTAAVRRAGHRQE